MLSKYRIIMLWLLLFLVLYGLLPSASAFAEQLNTSVKDCIEQPELCGEKSEAVNDKMFKNESNKELIEQTEANPVGITPWDFIKMILATIFVLFLLYFVLKFVNTKSNMFRNSRLMDNLGGIPLGSNRSVQIIKVGKRILVVGVGENIQLLKEIDDEDEYRELLTEYNGKLERLTQPNEWFTKLLGIFNRDSKKDMGKVAEPFQSVLQERLKEMAEDRKKVYEEVEKYKGTDKQ